VPESEPDEECWSAAWGRKETPGAGRRLFLTEDDADLDQGPIASSGQGRRRPQSRIDASPPPVFPFFPKPHSCWVTPIWGLLFYTFSDMGGACSKVRMRWREREESSVKNRRLPAPGVSFLPQAALQHSSSGSLSDPFHLIMLGDADLGVAVLYI
jgi:hypothetical protein